ncbi:dynein intermediate chain 2, ciliary [Onthophagus taurus]|uniref:dynein intermediate chain 2, ciliary n=1 Tax=Onthophagus taurus TaxID=166361 RepID=UPI000C20606F|nr:dynein intermediate chain 2, ciliary [Onthophagus taurus]
MPPTPNAKKIVASTPKKRAKSSSQRVDADDDLEEWKKSKQLLKPKDQVQLEDVELKEIVPRILMTKNFLQPDGLVEYNYLTGEFTPIPNPGNMVVVYETKGTYILLNSDEARAQLIALGIDPLEYVQLPEEEETGEIRLDEPPVQDLGEGEEGEEEEEEDEHEEHDHHDHDDDAEPEHPAAGPKKKLTNQFNFCERAALTYNNPVRSQGTQTTPPPIEIYSGNVLQWIIYDAYLIDFAEQEAERERERLLKEKDKAPVGKHGAGPVKRAGPTAAELTQGRIYEAWKVLERMLNQNTYNDIAKDYRYWEDPSDEFREEVGTLLPLWKFVYEKTKTNNITDILWNPWYYDLFAVCYGFFDFTKPVINGALCLFTIKNPSFPEHICMTQSAVMCVDIHKKFPYMCVIGLYDGSVEVYNVQASCRIPAFKSNAVTNKHSGIVTEVKWAPDLPDGELNFYSVAGDGKVNNWILMLNTLSVTTITTMYMEKDPVPGPDGTFLKIKSCATCFVFHPKQPLIFYVGTEEGLIYKCNTHYSSTYLLTLKAHHGPVYRIDFNKYNTDIFISCSADWRMKIWEDNRLEPLYVFDIGASVGDVKWAPYSSTVFAGACADGKVYVYDLNVNKYKPICIQAVVSKKRNKLTRIDFNYKLPFIIVGDDKGCITSLKLSPNLRVMCKPPKKQQYLDQWTLQCMKLDKLLSLVREPVTLTLPPDTSTTKAS